MTINLIKLCEFKCNIIIPLVKIELNLFSRKKMQILKQMAIKTWLLFGNVNVLTYTSPGGHDDLNIFPVNS